VTLPMRALGEHAARILLDRIEGADGPPRHVLLPTQLTIRASCGAGR
jgi:LacI family transcriptional regulator